MFRIIMLVYCFNRIKSKDSVANVVEFFLPPDSSFIPHVILETDILQNKKNEDN